MDDMEQVNGLRVMEGGSYRAMIWNNLVIDSNGRLRKKSGITEDSTGLRSSMREKILEAETDPVGDARCHECREKKTHGIFFVWNDRIGLRWKLGLGKRVGIQFHCKECLMENEKHKGERWENVVENGDIMN